MTSDEQDRSESTALVAIERGGEERQYRVGARVLTMERATSFAKILLSSIDHTVETAALEAGLRPSTVRDAIHRYNRDQCKTLADEEVCELIYRAKCEHMRDIRAEGFQSAASKNRAGTSWAQWQLEVQAPLEHPRKQETTVEHVGKDGGPIQTQNSVRYVVGVPLPEPEEDEAE
jgi:hypothetical protein